MRASLFAIFYLLTAISHLLAPPALRASPETLWVVRTNFANPARTNAVHSMQFDYQGDILVAGSAPSAAGNDLDYALIKYTQNGQVLWQATYNSGPGADDRLRGMALDPQGNVYVTGTSRTVKYNSSGVLQWVANYGGRALAVDTTGFVVVVGFQTNDFATVKIAADAGTNVWIRTFDYSGRPDLATAVDVGPGGEVYVGGTFSWVCDKASCYVKFGLVKYNTEGTFQWSQIWQPPDALHNANYPEESGCRRVVVIDSNTVIQVGNFTGGTAGHFVTGVFDALGTNKWIYNKPGVNSGMLAMHVASNGEILMTGWGQGDALAICRTIALASNGVQLWEQDYNPMTQSYHRANGISGDAQGNTFITAQSAPTYFSPAFDFLTIKYDHQGRSLWEKRYNGPTGGRDVGRGILSAPDGSLFVSGHSANASGGNDFVLIKYMEVPAIVWQGNQVLLQFCATNGQPCRFQASTNLSDWQDLATVAPDTNGICRYTDTAVPAHPHRFYRTVTP